MYYIHLKIQIVAANLNFLPNKPIFCCGKYSRGKTIQWRKLGICGNIVNINGNQEKYQVQQDNIKNQGKINRGLNSQISFLLYRYFDLNQILLPSCSQNKQTKIGKLDSNFRIQDWLLTCNEQYMWTLKLKYNLSQRMEGPL